MGDPDRPVDRCSTDGARALGDELARAAAQLLLIDELLGEPLTESEWLSLVRNMANHGLEQMRIAHVKPHGLQRIEYCEIFARDAGFQAHVFENEVAAMREYIQSA